MSNLLEGVRVIESAMLFNGDSLGMYLADMGAEVIKVEAPGRGDYIRDMLGQITPHHSPAHLQVNKNKRSVTLDLRSEAGRDAFFELIATADVFVDGFAGDACDKLGVGYEAQRQVKPDIVYCQYSGFGSTGPYAQIPTHGKMMNALAGGTPMRVDQDGVVRSDPTPELMYGIASAGEGTAAGAAHAAMHVAAALFHRERTGDGAFLDAAASDAVISAGWIGATYTLNEHRIVDRSSVPTGGGAEGSSAKYQYYATKDQKFVLFCAIEPKFWNSFCRLVDRPDLVDEKSSAPVDFAVGQERLRDEIQSIIITRTLAEWMDVATVHGLPIGPAYRSRDIVDDPHLATRQILVEGEHPRAGSFTYVGEPVIVRGQPYAVPAPAPRLGEHTDEVLTGLGWSADRIEALRAAGGC